MTRAIKLFLASLLALSPVLTHAGGDEVVVIYNSRLPESKSLADFYARKREVPPQQVLGFDMTDGEEMSRQDFRNDLQRPLAKKLEELKLWRTGRGDIPSTNGTRVRVSKKVVESKIRYAVLCYGVPLKIRRDTTLNEAEESSMRPELRRGQRTHLPAADLLRLHARWAAHE